MNKKLRKLINEFCIFILLIIPFYFHSLFFFSLVFYPYIDISNLSNILRLLEIKPFSFFILLNAIGSLILFRIIIYYFAKKEVKKNENK